jgi:delta1-piperideine-2-carboxylate reductase
MSNTNLKLNEINDLATKVLLKYGCDNENASAVANVIESAEAAGCHSHGLMRLPGYVATLKSGKVNGKARPTIESLAPAVVKVNGHNGFAPYALHQGRNHLIEAANKCGIAVMSLVGIHHFAALWTEVEPIAKAGLVAFACTSYKPAVIPAGGTKALYGTNPIAFGWPRKNNPPMVFDQASSVMARGEVMLAAREGHKLPDGVGVDINGKPSNDPNEVLKGALLAFGGHKGSSIAMMVELLAGGLIGESFSFEAAVRDNADGGPPQGGELMIAINPNLLGDSDNWSDHSEKLFDKIKEQKDARLPSDRRHRNRIESNKSGVMVADILLDKISSL